MSVARVLIAGAGPVGLTLALELARRGIRPRIVDAGPDFTPAHESRALAVNHRSLQLLAPSGVSQRLIGAGHKLNRFHFVNEKGRSVIRVDLAGAGLSQPWMLILPQGDTERLIAAALSDYDVQPEWNTRLEAIGADPAAPRVELNRDGRTEEHAPDILIGADGARSAVRAGFGFDFTGKNYPVEFGLGDYNTPEACDEEFFVRFTRAGPIVRIPMGDGRVRLVSPNAALIEREALRLGASAPLWRSNFHVSYRYARMLQRGSVFLAGDAAHVHSPVGGRGMNLGIEDAAWLAWMISEGRTDDYFAIRMPEITRVIAETRRQTDLIVKMSPMTRFVRDHIAGVVLNIAPVKRAALSRLFGLDTKDPPWL